MPNKVSLKERLHMSSGLVLVGLAMFGLSGCSAIGSGVNAVGQGLVYTGESIEKGLTDVKVQKMSDDQFSLSQVFYEPVTSLDSSAMRIEAREACPKGYIYLSRNARKNGSFAYSEAQCEGEMSCAYQLEWRIKCQDVPDEPFSLFGKT